jgi:hypothetical protein
MPLNEIFDMMEEDEYCGNRSVESGGCPFLGSILARRGNEKAKSTRKGEDNI